MTLPKLGLSDGMRGPAVSRIRGSLYLDQGKAEHSILRISDRFGCCVQVQALDQSLVTRLED
jgi:hypothetical protein